MTRQAAHAPRITPLTFGTTGTGLDEAIATIASDAGLNLRLSGKQLLGGMTAADGINGLIVQAIRATGAANDKAITTSDVYAMSAWIRANHLESFTALHGNDENMVETGFHLVQGDGSFARSYGLSTVDNVLDSIYHIGFQIIDGRFVNEDGNANAAVDEVAFWLNDMLQGDLAAGALAVTVDPQVHGMTGTGLDALLERMVDDAGLNNNVSQTQINEGAAAADGMNRLIVQGIRATGIADDGDITALDMYALNGWIRAGHRADWTAFHGDDEGRIETGFHLLQGDGGTDYLYGEDLINTVADGIYHIGFNIMWDRFVNEDGNGNASLDDTAQWLSLILAGDLASGALDSGKGPVDPARFAADIDYQTCRTVTV
jgi:hypothetical protein